MTCNTISFTLLMGYYQENMKEYLVLSVKNVHWKILRNMRALIFKQKKDLKNVFLVIIKIVDKRNL
jgi:hypothetical protein